MTSWFNRAKYSGVATALALAILWTCSAFIGRPNASRSGIGTTGQALQNTDQEAALIGTWYAKSLLINGKPDPENFPVNNDELTLREDHTMRMYDRTMNFTVEGIWKLEGDTHLTISGEGESFHFTITEVSANRLVKHLVLEPGVTLVVTYNRTM